MRPIFHLSVPVRDLQEAVDFYSTYLDARIGRHTQNFADALMFGAQITLQNDPANVSDPMPRTRHFGTTLPWDEWETFVSRFTDGAVIVEAPTISYEGELTEQGKMMITDPSGNLIEIKTYRHPNHVLGLLSDT
jgi:extradiol dioxygenase family protein